VTLSPPGDGPARSGDGDGGGRRAPTGNRGSVRSGDGDGGGRRAPTGNDGSVPSDGASDLARSGGEDRARFGGGNGAWPDGAGAAPSDRHDTRAGGDRAAPSHRHDTRAGGAGAAPSHRHDTRAGGDRAAPSDRHGTRAGGDRAGPSDGDDELASAYWWLGPAGGDDTSVRHLARRLPRTLRLVLTVVREAAPRAAATVLLLQLAAGLASAFGLLATRGVLEELLAAGPTAERVTDAVPALAVVVAAYAVRGALVAGAALAQARIGPAVERVAGERLLVASLGVELAGFDDPAFYDRLHRARDRGLFHVQRSTDNLVEVLGAAIAVAAAAVSVGVLHPVLLPVLLLGVVPEGWAVLRSARLGYASVARTVTLSRRLRMVGDLATDRAPAAEIRAAQAEPFLLDEYGRLADELRDEQVRVGTAQARAQTLGRALAGVGTAATLVTLGVLLHAGWVALAVAGTAVVAVRTATAALAALVLAANQLFEQGMYVADFEAFTAEAANRTRPPGAQPPAGGPREVALHDVGFRYPGTPSGRPALDGVTLTIRRGETVALVGENGSGKTTLAKVLAGLYRPTTGTVTWDGVDLADLDPAAATRRVAVVLQDPVRWPHDARTNVRVGRHDRPDPGDVALHEAAGLAMADAVVDRLPLGWRSLLSKEFRHGRELSTGEWQRFAVARGLFRDADLVLWDEPTAPLDARAEAAVYESLRRIAEGRTVVMITHRLASVRHADRIYVLHRGRLVEQGTHDELVARGGHYAELFDLQARLHADPRPAGAGH
jgi:ATP-binding cassette, subfamily B, bacterial